MSRDYFIAEAKGGEVYDVRSVPAGDPQDPDARACYIHDFYPSREEADEALEEIQARSWPRAVIPVQDIVDAFHGFQDDSDVHGGDLVDFIDVYLERLRGCVGLVVEVEGGCVTRVHQDGRDVAFTLRDQDNIAAGDEDPLQEAKHGE